MEYITEVIRLDKNFPFAIYDGKGFSNDAVRNGKIYMHKHYCLEINFVLSDGGTYYIGENAYPIRKNDIFIINNYEYHYAVNETGKMELMVIVFDPDLVWTNEQIDFQYLKTFYECKVGFRHRLSGDTFVQKNISNILFEMNDEWNKKATGYCLVIKSLLLKLLALLYRRFETIDQFSEKLSRFENEYAKIIDAVDYINQNYREKIKLSFLAEMVHMNTNYFSSYFKKVMNSTVSEYTILRRIKYACLRLSTSDDAIITIASDSGFENVPYFNRTFKKLLGITPRGYRDSANSQSKV